MEIVILILLAMFGIVICLFLYVIVQVVWFRVIFGFRPPPLTMTELTADLIRQKLEEVGEILGHSAIARHQAYGKKDWRSFNSEYNRKYRRFHRSVTVVRCFYGDRFNPIAQKGSMGWKLLEPYRSYAKELQSKA
jgi:hypothetical protein